MLTYRVRKQKGPLARTWRTGATVEGAHGVQALHHGSGGAAAIIGQTFIHILAAVAVALPT